MGHVFEGQPDDRQAGDIKPSRFRPRYRALSDEEKALHDAIKAKAVELEELFDRARDLRIPGCRELPPAKIDADGISRELQIGEADHPAAEYFFDGQKSLELAVMWTVKGLTS